MTISYLIRAEEPDDDPSIIALQLDAFGPGAFARAAFRVREQAPHDPARSFVGLLDGALIASVRLTPIVAGTAPGLLLGPLVVAPEHKNKGYGRALLRHAVERVREVPDGARFILLVGDASYYGPFGFSAAWTGAVEMPGPVDAARLLAVPIVEGGAEGLKGMVRGVCKATTGEAGA